ncbi:MAG: four helix bundle protein [Phycisphaerales bacterium]
MTSIRTHRDLIAWQKSFEMGLHVYKLTSDFPKSEERGLRSQLRRAAVSVASNIAEGYGRGSKLDYLRFLKIARGSIFEIDTQIRFALRLGFISKPAMADLDERLRECDRLLSALIRSISRSDHLPA